MSFDRYYWDEAVQRSGLKSATRHVGHVLVTFCNGGHGYLTNKDLQERTGYSASTVKRSVDVLALCGFITVHQQAAVAMPNSYSFHVPSSLPGDRPAVADRAAVYQTFAEHSIKFEAEYLAGRGLSRTARTSVSRTVEKDGEGKFIGSTSVRRTAATASRTDDTSVSGTDAEPSPSVRRTAEEPSRRYDVPHKKPTTKKPTTSSASDDAAAAPDEAKETISSVWGDLREVLEEWLESDEFDGLAVAAYRATLKLALDTLPTYEHLSKDPLSFLQQKLISHAADRFFGDTIPGKDHPRLYRCSKNLGTTGALYLISTMASTNTADITGNPTSYLIRSAEKRKAETA